MFKVKNLIILINILIILLVIELFFAFILGFKSKTELSTCERIYDRKNDFHRYSPNCEIIVKHWEQDNFVSYQINSEGRRDLAYLRNNSRKVAFIGDSFTFGAMVPIEDNYNFYAFNNILNSSFELHNYGTPAEQLHNVFNKLNTLDESKYDYIVYGLTPNDFFDLVDDSFNNKLKNVSEANKEDKTEKIEIKIFNKMRSLLLSTATSRFILHSLMSIDSIYLKTYLSRKPYSGYLLKNLPNEWIKAIDFFDETLNNLEIKYKSKLKIFILPQRADVISNRLNSYNPSLVNAVVNICKKTRLIAPFLIYVL